MNSRHAPPTIVLVVEPPELFPPLLEEVGSIEEVVEVDVVVGETVEEVEVDEVDEVEEEVEVEVEMETTDGAGGAASGSLPAAFASVGSNAPFYTQSVKHTKYLLVECTYHGPIYKRPMWGCTVERDWERVPACW